MQECDLNVRDFEVFGRCGDKFDAFRGHFGLTLHHYEWASAHFGQAIVGQVNDDHEKMHLI